MVGRCVRLLLTVCALTAVGRAEALDVSLRASPDFFIPVLDSPALFSVGGGATVAADLELFGLFAPSIETSFRVAPGLNTEKNLLLTSAGLGASAFFYPVPRVKLRFGAAAGPYLGAYKSSVAAGGYWKARAEAGYRFSPSFSLCAGAEFFQYISTRSTLLSGLSIGVTADVSTALFTERDSGLSVEPIEDKPVFPILSASYETTPFGRVNITNREQGEIRDVEVSFAAGRYSSRQKVCAAFPLIRRGETVSAPLHLSLNEQVLSLTEPTKVQGELSISYSLLDSRLQARKPLTVRFNHRNAVDWSDERMAAVFVSPNDPAVLEYSKFVAGLVRERLRPGVDRNLQYGMALFEGLRLSGIACAPDPNTPYQDYHGGARGVDYLQYPHQTLAYHGGDCDDVCILYAAILESVGVRAAFIPLRGDFLVAFPLASTEADARATFSDMSSLVIRDGAAWVPLRASLVREGFLSAWQGGVQAWKDAQGSTPVFYRLGEAWKAFPPVGVTGEDAAAVRPAEPPLLQAFENVVSRFVAREIGPRIGRLLSEMGPSGGTVRQQNAAGLMYARYGMLAEAQEQFMRAASVGYVPALVNLGNIAFLRKSWDEAAGWFSRALESQPENKAALLGLARARYEMDQFSASDELFSRVLKLDPSLADRFAYLSSRMEGSASRAAAVDRTGVLWSQEGE